MPVPPEVNHGKSGHGNGMSSLGMGCFTAEMIPPHSPSGCCYSIAEDKVVSELLSAQASHLVGDSQLSALSYALQRLTLKETAQ